MNMKTIIIVILCSLVALGVGYIWKAKLSKDQVEALIEIEVSERQDAKREQILTELQEQIYTNEELLTKISSGEKVEQDLVDARNALLAAKNKLADTIKAGAEDSKIIIAFKDENAALYNTLDKTTDIIKDNNETIAKLTEAVKDSTEDLKKAKDQIEKHQEEISGLRDSLKDLVKITDKNKIFSVGVGATMPTGVELVFTMNIPKIPFGLFSSAALTTGEPINYTLAAGILYAF